MRLECRSLFNENTKERIVPRTDNTEMPSLFYHQISRRTTSETVFGIDSAALFPARLSRQISRSIFLYPPAVLSNFDELLKEFDKKRLAWRVGPWAYISTTESILKFAYLSHSLRFPSFIPCSSFSSSFSSSTSSSPLTRSLYYSLLPRYLGPCAVPFSIFHRITVSSSSYRSKPSNGSLSMKLSGRLRATICFAWGAHP